VLCVVCCVCVCLCCVTYFLLLDDIFEKVYSCAAWFAVCWSTVNCEVELNHTETAIRDPL